MDLAMTVMNKRLVVSSRNPHKLTELGSLLGDLGIEVVPAASLGVPEVEETGETFLDNALLKASAAFDVTGSMALADDSGLVVEALGGEPGVRSARFAGLEADDADNNRLLLARLEGVPESERKASFVCTLTLLVPEAMQVPSEPDALWRRVDRSDIPDGAVLYAIEGRANGVITTEPAGRSGFGYDPLFLYPPAGLTFAQLEPAAKNQVSHRGLALAGLRFCILQLMGER